MFKLCVLTRWDFNFCVCTQWKKARQIEEEMGRQHQGMHRPGVRQVPEGSEEQGKIEETGCTVICGAQTTPAAKVQVKVNGTPT